MRRTQEVSSYVSMVIMLIGGVAFMVGVLIHDGFAATIYNFIYWILGFNLAVLTGFGAFLVVVIFYAILRHQFTV